jgi:hypothetical protein
VIGISKSRNYERQQSSNQHQVGNSLARANDGITRVLNFKSAADRLLCQWHAYKYGMVTVQKT